MEASAVPMAPPPRPPPPPMGEELVDWEEGCTAGESSPPPIWGLHEVQGRIYERLRRTGRHGEALADPAFFQRRLARHLQRMPTRYIADVDMDGKAEDVLLHCRIIDVCADPDKRPVFHARHVKSITVRADCDSGDEELDQPGQRLMEDLSLEGKTVHGNNAVIMSSRTVHVHEIFLEEIHVHEIIFCSVDKRKLLCQVAELLDEVGLHIREGHLYCTIDGFCLAIFSVDGWETEEADGLIAKIYETLALKTAQQSNSTNSSTPKKILDIQQKLEILKLTGTC